MGLVRRMFTQISEKTWGYLATSLFPIVRSLDTQARVWAYDLLSCGCLQNFDLFTFFLESLTKETSDFVQACIIFNIQRWVTYNHPPKEAIDDMVKCCTTVVENEKFKPLAKMAAAAVLLRASRGISDVSVIDIMVEVIIHPHKYADLWKAEKLEAPWTLCNGGRSYREPNPARIDFANYAADTLMYANQTSRKKHVLPPLLDALMQASDTETTKSIIFALLVAVFEKDHLTPGVYYEELDQGIQDVLKCLAAIPATQNHTDILDDFSLPDDLKTFIETPVPPELRDPKKQECIDGLIHVDWTKLRHAYGQAGDIPGIVKALASRNAQRRDHAINDLFAVPYHQGRRFSCTVPLIGYIMKFLECKTIEAKDKLLEWLECVAVGFPDDFALLRFDSAKEFPEEETNDQETEVARKCFAEVEKGCPIYLNFLLQGDLLCKTSAIALLSRFPKFKSESVPQITTIYNNPKEDALARSTAILALGHLADKAEATKLQEMLLPKLEVSSTHLPGMGISDLAVLSLEAFTFSMIVGEFSEKKELPFCVKTIIIHALSHMDPFYRTGFGEIVINTQLVMRNHKDQFFSLLLDRFFVSPSVKTAEMLLGTFFEHANYGVAYYFGQVPEYFEEVIDTTDKQAEVLNVLVSCDTLWPEEEGEQSKMDFSGYLQSAITISKILQNYLGLKWTPTRAQMRASLAKREEEQKNGGREKKSKREKIR